MLTFFHDNFGSLIAKYLILVKKGCDKCEVTFLVALQNTQSKKIMRSRAKNDSSRQHQRSQHHLDGIVYKNLDHLYRSMDQRLRDHFSRSVNIF